jgi:acetyl esterase/lipase
MRSFFFVFLIFFSGVVRSQEVIRLSNDVLPTLRVFRPSKDSSKGIGLIVCSGGAYAFRSDAREGIPACKILRDAGITTFLLDYDLPEGNDTLPLHDAYEAIRFIRLNAAVYKIDKKKVGILGFSAGGHLASTAGTHFRNANERPDFMVLVCPVISMADSITHTWSRSNLFGSEVTPKKIKLYSNEVQVSDSTPGTFIVHAIDDDKVKVGNSLFFEAALLQHHVPVQLFLYAQGGHAFNLQNKTAAVQWTGDCTEWIIKKKWRKKWKYH